jgi:predicted Rdx family selenoprotein
VSAGIWERILQRVSDAGFPDAVEECQRVLDDLICQERAEIHNAVSGAGYQSLWQREC